MAHNEHQQSLPRHCCGYSDYAALIDPRLGPLATRNDPSTPSASTPSVVAIPTYSVSDKAPLNSPVVIALQPHNDDTDRPGPRQRSTTTAGTPSGNRGRDHTQVDSGPKDLSIDSRHDYPQLRSHVQSSSDSGSDHEFSTRGRGYRSRRRVRTFPLRRASKAESTGPVTSKEMHLKVPQVVDDEYTSEAEMSGLDEYYHADTHASRGDQEPSSQRQRRITPQSRQGRSTDSEDNVGGAHWGGNLEVYDSDLESTVGDVGMAAHAKKMRRYKALARDTFERMLLDCIVNTDSIRPNYEDIFVDSKVIHQLERVTKMSLTRPKAYSHGVLAGNKVTGGVLYGPPGTGKSLLAKATARESGFNMILASTAELWQKCHGDDEKVIKALFSLARKLHPCIVFIDEAEAMLGTRKAGEKRHIRAMLNQFLMEWDGLSSGADSPFILLATNRPFDLDPAVLRRAPVRILLDIPNLFQRCGILRLYLKDEKLAKDVSIERLAKMTPRYTGSDLKNLCVAAATECIWEQDEDTSDRVLALQHFQSAMVTIKATGLSKTMENDFNNFKNGSGKDAVPGMMQPQDED